MSDVAVLAVRLGLFMAFPRAMRPGIPSPARPAISNMRAAASMNANVPSPLIEKKKAEKKKRLEDAFAMFALGQGIPLVAEALEVSKGTARNYYAEWKKTWKNSGT